MHARKQEDSSSSSPFPIVGIGASAGGLEALTLFLSHVPASSGMAFVVVQHLDPHHKCIMAELLQRVTPMPVHEVGDRQKILPDCVYILPPDKDLSILHGVLHLLNPGNPRGLRLPVDFFFRTLAQDQQERSIGVILSGMGSDGTLGLRAIKEQAGLVLVQEPASAKFDSMPRSAIDAGLADIIAPVEELPGKLSAYLARVLPKVHAGLVPDRSTQTALEKIVILLRLHVGHDFSSYKKSTLYRRIERRMALHQIEQIAHYVRYLQENPQEQELLFNELLIGVTSFFRDPDAWKQLKEQILPTFFTARPEGYQLRAWVAGCSTGEEAYSLAMVFKEALEQVKPKGQFSLQIYGTDLDRGAIARARRGIYPANIAADVSADRLRRFFIKDEGGKFQVVKEIRDMVVVAVQNVIMDPPFTKLDILICRNLLIYFDTDLQKKLLPVFHYSLNPHGVLFLGSAESVGGHSDLFSALEGKWRFYNSNTSNEQFSGLNLPPSFYPHRDQFPQDLRPQIPTMNLQTICDQVLLKQVAPSAVMVNRKGDILYVSGRVGNYLEPAAGKANWNIFVMARDELRYELSNAFRKALRQNEAVIISGLKLKTDSGGRQVGLSVQLMREHEALRGMLMVIFTDVALPPELPRLGAAAKKLARGGNTAELPREIVRLRQELKSVTEDMQAAQEELRSANEEMQSTNEELQSTNEELTTSKEEMQSLNEELQTVNSELQGKLDELSLANNDMKNLLNSTEIATVFLDSELKVRRFTTQATHLIKLIPSDIGRPVTDIATDLLYPELAREVEEVLRTLSFSEKQITTRDERWFNSRIMPYRTLENKIDGVVITFADITAAKKLEQELRAQPHYRGKTKRSARSAIRTQSKGTARGRL